IQGGQIIAKVDLRKIDISQQMIPSMFSDAENTYLLVPKVTRGRVGFSSWFGPVSEDMIIAKYRIDLD
ncbi:MAG TPA: hypothetical protein VGZ26_07455, partial [Pirellulales bacterium]|nr:hypothetical protein [Pirellulales bacterium]